jgi:hypothetical protein
MFAMAHTASGGIEGDGCETNARSNGNEEERRKADRMVA